MFKPTFFLTGVETFNSRLEPHVVPDTFSVKIIYGTNVAQMLACSAMKLISLPLM